MSDELIDVVHAALDAFTRRDKESWSALTHPDLEMHPDPNWPEAGTLVGRDAVWEFYVQADEPWEPGAYRTTEIRVAGDRVFARQQRSNRGRSSGAELEFDPCVVSTFREGKVARQEWFADRDAALRASGAG